MNHDDLNETPHGRQEVAKGRAQINGARRVDARGMEPIRLRVRMLRERKQARQEASLTHP